MSITQTVRVTITGSSLSGSDGDSSRTYTLPSTASQVVSDSIIIISNNVALIEGASYDYSYSSGIVTFNNAMFDTDIIMFTYLIDITTTTTSTNDTKYTSLLAFNKFMQMDKEIPNRDSSGDPVKETIGIGTGSQTIFYLDHGYAIRNSETFYYGTSESTATDTLTQTTHYSTDYDLGKITLTSTGVTTLGTATIYASYSYNKYDFKDTELYQKLLRAESELDEAIGTVFYDDTTATPDFGTVSDETHQGRGEFDKIYYLDKYPVNDTTTTLNGAVTAGATAITVASTNGFPSSGYIAIETNKITYTGKSSTQFTGCTSAVAHDTLKTVTPFVIEVAIDSEGNTPNWVVQEYQSDYDIDFNSGMVRINNDSIFSNVLDNYLPPRTVWNRFRASYQYGLDTIPNDVVKCVHMIAGKELYDGSVLSALARGTNGFSSTGINGVTDQIKKVKEQYKCWQVTDVKP